MEAQRFPSDYDGIISGAPANFWTHLTDEFIWNMQATVQDSASYIPATKLPAIDAAALAACDARDGVQDGVIDSPDKCRFNPSKLLCQGPESDSCLTEPQVTALSKIYAGPRNRKGESIYPGDLPGEKRGPGAGVPGLPGARRERVCNLSLPLNFSRTWFLKIRHGITERFNSIVTRRSWMTRCPAY